MANFVSFYRKSLLLLTGAGFLALASVCGVCAEEAAPAPDAAQTADQSAPAGLANLPELPQTAFLTNTTLIQAPYINQEQNWITGCESVSATMLLQYLGMDISVDKFIFGYLDMKPVATGTDGQLYAPDPNQYFAGSPYSENSFGCYAPVIQKALQSALDQYGSQIGDQFEVVDLTGVSMDVLCKEYLDAGLPVVFWATIGMTPSAEGPSWTIPDTGESFTWKEHEHCMLLVGYDDTNYYFNDPNGNRGTVPYEKNLTLARHEEQYSMAVGVVPHGG